MDTLRGTFGSSEPGDAANLDETLDRDGADGADGADQSSHMVQHTIGQDERRMQVRAYNHWASLLEDRAFPLIEELDPANLPDFGPHSVLIDFTAGIDDPAVQFLGDRLAAECGAEGAIKRLSDVPPRSLLSRITDHYMQILANHAPIGFEAEFVNQRGASTLYRGILLPFSSDGETIDFLYGVINWKEIADQVAADELLLEIDQALDLVDEVTDDADADQAPQRRTPDPVTNWADSPASERASDDYANISPLNGAATEADAAGDLDDGLPVPEFGYESMPEPDFAQYALDDDYEEDFEDGENAEDDSISYSFASLADYIEAPAKKAIDPAEFVAHEVEPDAAAEPETDHRETSASDALDAGEAAEDSFEYDPEPAPETAEDISALDGNDTSIELPDDSGLDASLYDDLAAARELAVAANTTEDRSRCALYAAVSRAYDFSLAAISAPEDYAELIAQSGLTIQERAPMTPVVKLVFGADYDKTRLTEYAAVLSHAHRLKLARGTLAQFLEETDGGLKGVVKAERRLRRGDAGEEIETEQAMREALAAKLRELEALTLEALDGGGPEFALVMIRRDEVGCAAVIGELPEDIAFIERGARKLVG